MLKLHSASRPTWVHVAVANLDRILIDHAHCEKKAAATGLSLINRYPGREELVVKMTALVQEEVEHFARVFGLITRRGLKLPRDPGDSYVNNLMMHVRRTEPDRLLDSLIVASLIEARSCERFKLLADALPDGEEREMYASLMASEAGHHAMFLALAKKYFPDSTVDARFDGLARLESEICSSLRDEPFMHG